MLPSRHLLVSLPLGWAVWSVTQSLFAGIICLISGTLIDIDHLIEYFIHRGFKTLNLKSIYQSCGKLTRPETEGGIKKIFLFFHAAEISVLLWTSFVLTENIYLLAIALGYTVHLLMDIAANQVKPATYSLIWRIKKSFQTVYFIK
ncbi:MAG: hypothetical protein JW714_00890 [Candidatus Omnitrophica bacterium]|nr:hypothetical protein [Candidatus Omnitrophota bacterium]